MKYYIASPGFNEDQIARIRSVEKTLDEVGADYYSPFKNGDNLKLDDNEDLNKIRIKHIFNKNIEEIMSCDKMIAIVDDFDKGTAFEIGYFVSGRDVATINESLLLIGKLGPQISVIIDSVLEKLNDIRHESNKVHIVDITEKTLEDYILIGALYQRGYKIVTTSEGELSSNVMTACAVMCHQNNTTKEELAKELKHNNNCLDDLHYQLSAFKMFKKVE